MTRPTTSAAEPRPVRGVARRRCDSRSSSPTRAIAALSRADVGRWIRAALERPAEITVRIVDAAEGLALNRDFRGQDHATNVLTFAYATEPLLSADLVLCAPVVEDGRRPQGIALAARYAHLLSTRCTPRASTTSGPRRRTGWKRARRRSSPRSASPTPTQRDSFGRPALGSVDRAARSGALGAARLPGIDVTAVASARCIAEIGEGRR